MKKYLKFNEEGMGKGITAFWKWMKEKQYGYINTENSKVVWIKNQDGHNQNAGFPTKQMLIGYMIEYLLLTGKISWMRFGTWLHEEMDMRRFLKKGIILDGENHAEVIYDILINKIKEDK